MTLFKTTAVAACLLISSICFADDIYKWINEKGNISYGNNPPRGVEAHLVNTNGALPSESDVSEAKAISDSIEQATSSAKPTAAPDPSIAQAKQANCENAKAEFAKLAGASRIAVKDEAGNNKSIDSEQRKALVDEKQAAVDEACAP